MIISFPSPVEYHEWCEKFCSLLSTKSPQSHHHHHHHLNAPYTPQQVSKVIQNEKEKEQSVIILFSPYHLYLVQQ
jgi:hypothetical protein